MKKVIYIFLIMSLGNCKFPSLEKSIFEILSLLQFIENQQTFSLTVQVSDLLGEELILSNNGESLTISGNGSHTFSATYKRNETYNVAVSRQPTNPSQNCEVSGGTGNFISGNVDTVQVSCGEGLLPVSGTVNNLSGSGLQISNTTDSGTETINVTSTSFAFPAQEEDSTYNLSIISQPTSPWQTCSITAPAIATGTVTGTGLTITIDCVTDEFPLSVQVIGIGGAGTLTPGDELQIQVNGGEVLNFDGDATSSFPTSLPSGTAYSLAILNANSEIATGICSIPSPNGTIQGATETVIVNCSAGFTISGTVTIPTGFASSILGTGLTLRLENTGGTFFANQDLNLNTGQTNYTFATAVPVGAEYRITILNQPNTPSQLCTVSGTGTGAPVIIVSSVTDIDVDCSLPSPEFVTLAGDFPNLMDVEIDTPISGAEIRYELGDGSQTDPLCASSPIYMANIPITDNFNNVIKAIQCSPDWTTQSQVATSDIYNLKVATPTSSIADGSSVDQGDTAVFSTITTATTWNCWRDANAPTAAVDPGCGATANTCNGGDSIGNYIHPGALNKNVKVRTCRVGFEESDILNLELNLNTYSISGSITGLTTPFANDFVLQNNLADDLNITANGSFTFATAIASGANYDVTRLSGPTNPWQDCVLTNTNGTITNANITNVTINCSLEQYTVSGTISGPSTGDINPGTTITIDPGASVGPPIVYNPGDPPLDFGTFDSGTPIDLQITQQPEGQHCSFVDPLGLVGDIQGANLVVDIQCVNGHFTAGGNIQLIKPTKLGYHLFRGSVDGVGSGVGSDTSGYADGTLDTAEFNSPKGLAFDGTFFYVADELNNRIRRVNSTNGQATTFAGDGTTASVDGVGTGASFHFPKGLALDGTNLYVSDRGAGTGTAIRRINIETEQVTTLAGGTSGFQDGFGGDAQFNNPYGLAIHKNYLYIADTNNNRIRRLNLNTNEVTTYIGDGSPSNVDGVATGATILAPIEMVVLGDDLYITSVGGHCIRKVDLTTDQVTTVAGSPGIAGHVDAVGTNARLTSPHGLTTDGTDLYFVETNTGRMRLFDIESGEVATILGSGGSSYTAGVGARAGLNNPTSIGTNGKIFFFTEEHGIRLIFNHNLEAFLPLAGNLVNYELDSPDITLNQGTVAFDTGRFGEPEGSLVFDGNTRYSTTLDSNYQQISLAGWFLWNGSAGGLQLLLHLGVNPTGDGLGLYLKGTGADPDSEKLHIRYGSEMAKPVNHFKMRPNEWIHLAITRGNATNPANVYANGKLIFSETIVTGTAVAGINYRLGGSDQAGGTEFFTGNIADVRHYNRVLNEGEINELSKGATQTLVGHTYNTNGAVGLVAHYDFNTAIGLDRGPNSNLANNSGSPTVARGTDGTNNSARYTKSGSFQTNSPIFGLPTGSAPRTICSWVKPDQLPVLDTNQVVVVYGDVPNHYGLSIRNNAGIQSIVALNTGSNQEALYTLPLHSWTYICTAFNGTDVTFYAGGKQLGAGIPITVNTNIGGSSTLTIGSYFVTGENFTGKLDDIRIYNRALTLAEIRRLGAQNYNGLVARFDFEGDYTDVSGFGSILTPIVSGPILSEDRFGNTGSAYLFDGDGNFRTSAANPYFPFPEGNSPVSICAWVRADQEPTGIVSAVGYGSGTAYQNIWLGVRNLNTLPSPETCSLGTTCGSTPRFSRFVWEHLCVAQSETEAKLFYNGRQVSATPSGTWNKVATNLMIGALNNNYRFPGNIDEVTIYNRELSEDEIRALAGYHPYQTTSWDPVIATSALKLYLKADSLSDQLDSSEVLQWKDSSGTGNDVIPPGNAPIYEKQGLLNRPTVLFEPGDGNYLRKDTGIGFSTGGSTSFYVLERNTNTSVDTVLSYGPNPNGYRSFFGNGADTMYVFVIGDGLHRLISNNIFTTNTPHLISKRVGGSSQIFDRGFNQTSAQNSAAFNATGPLEIGALIGGTDLYDGRISEILYFNNTLSNADRFRVECYLSEKYGLALDTSLNCD